jgi:hypothetical protein
MLVYWVTSNKTTSDYSPTLMYGPNPNTLSSFAAGSNTNYTAFGLRSPSLHVATATGLTPATMYWYRVGDPQYGWSDLLNFTSAPALGSAAAYPINFIAYGTMEPGVPLCG